MFYAVKYAYGSTVVNHGNRPNTVYSFRTRTERDEFVEHGDTDYIDQSGYREEISADHTYVRWWRSHAKRHGTTIDRMVSMDVFDS